MKNKGTQFHEFIEAPNNADKNETEQAAINGLLELGYQQVESRSHQKILKKDATTIEIFYNGNDGGHELIVSPSEDGPAIYRWFLESTPFLSEIQWELTLFEFWNNQRGVLAFTGQIQSVLHSLVEQGYTYRCDDRAVVRAKHINILKLTKGHVRDAQYSELHIAFETRLPKNGYYGTSKGNGIWIRVSGQIRTLQVAALLSNLEDVY